MRFILKKLSALIYKNRLLFLIFWVAILTFSIFFLANFKEEIIETELSGARGTEAERTANILVNDFKIKSGNSSAIVTDNKVDTDLLISELKNNFPQIKSIFSVSSQKQHRFKLIYIDYKAGYLFVEIQGLTENIREFIKPFEKKYNSKIYVTGSASFYYDMKDAGKKDSAKGEVFALAFSLIILIFNFGALISALIPILVGTTTIIFANTISKMSGMEIIPMSQILTSLVGIALSIDYSLFMVSRYREELKKGTEHYVALTTSLSNSGKTIIVSALIMLCSISVLLIPDVSSSRIVVKNLLVVVMVSFLNSIFFLPVFLIYTKGLLDKPEFLAKLLKNSDNYLLWKKFSTYIVNKPKRHLILSLTILILLSLPVYNIKLWEPSQTLAPDESESMTGYKLLEKDNWGGELVPVEIAVETPGVVYEKEFISFIFDFSRYLEKNPEVSSVQSITSWNSNFSKEQYFNFLNTLYTTGFFTQLSPVSSIVNVETGNNITLIKVFPKSLMDVDASHRIIKYAREFNHKSKYQVSIGGMIARARDFTNELYNYIPLMLSLIFFSIYLLLFLYMKSIILPIKAGIMNFLPILSSFGILTLIFQYGYFHEILKTNVNNAVTAMVPITLFCIVFGLSMDYEVLILSRISENYEETGDVKLSVVEGLSRSGSVITGAALILLVVFIPGIFSSSPGIKEICIGIVSAIFIDSTIVRLLLVPSFVVLMGKWNWWNPLSPLTPLSEREGDKKKGDL